jgi:16S rRNA (cytosine1402-N4)-methyltransferase
VLETAKDLRKCLEQEYGSNIQIKVLAKLFQALRIAVNGELDELKNCCEKTLRYLNAGGRFAVLSYHSLEDRIVKNFMRDNEKGCTCPPGLPMCVCNRKPILKRVSTRAIKSTDAEISHNVASRSARLRVAERIAL